MTLPNRPVSSIFSNLFAHFRGSRQTNHSDLHAILAVVQQNSLGKREQILIRKITYALRKHQIQLIIRSQNSEF
jgi:hypothetical protein